jgi:bifunctional non-homologous end joining protein LigD
MMCGEVGPYGRMESKVPLPQFQPMPLAVLNQPFDYPDWLFECKYDGFRALAYVENRRVRLVSRKGHVYRSFPRLCSAMSDCLSVRDAVLDGEIVHLDAEGKPQFISLLRRRSPQEFVAFDVLWSNGTDLRNLPLVERKRILRSVVPAGSASILYADYIDKNGTALFEEVCRQDLEGMVAKRKDGLYRPAETSWVKIRNTRYS